MVSISRSRWYGLRPPALPPGRGCLPCFNLSFEMVWPEAGDREAVVRSVLGFNLSFEMVWPEAGSTHMRL